MLNLILGEKLLPSSTLSKTSTIWELKYGATPKLVVYFKDKDPESGHTTKTVWLNPQQSYLHEITSFVHAKTNRGKSSDYKKLDLFLPHCLLKVGSGEQKLHLKYLRQQIFVELGKLKMLYESTITQKGCLLISRLAGSLTTMFFIGRN